MLDSYIKFLRAHQPLIIAAAVILSVVWCFNLYVTKNAEHAHDQSIIEQQKLLQQQQANEQTAKMVQQSAQQLQVVQTRVDVVNAKLDADIALRRRELAKQQEMDANYSLPDLANRWNALIGTNGVAPTGNALAVDEPTSRATVQQLEFVPALRNELVDMNTKLNGEKEKVAACTDLTGKLQEQVKGKDAQIAQQQTACDGRVKEVETKARKDKSRWALFGTIVGYILRGAL